MAKVVLKQRAIDDLNNIWRYTFDNWSESQADKYYTMLRHCCNEIGENPEIGREYHRITRNLFGVHSGRHIIFYQLVDENEIEIIRILHEQMDLKNRLNE